MTVGQRIQQARKKAGLSQKQLGEKLGLSASMIGQWENDLRNPKYDTLKRIAAALDTEAWKLMGHDSSIRVRPQSDKKDIPPAEALNHLLSTLDNIAKTFPAADKLDWAIQRLNDSGQEKLADYALDLIKIPEYRAETDLESPPAPQEGKDTTPPPDAPETPPEGE